MKLQNKTAEFYVYDQTNPQDALKKTTHMAIAAHHDDIEIMAYDGILKCFNHKDNHFFGVVVTDGSGSARDGEYQHYTNEAMMHIRKSEQRKAAHLGQYALLAMLDYESSAIKDPANELIIKELALLIQSARPDILYTHNLADKHSTHIGVVTKVIKAIRTLAKEDRPKAVYGCEVWRDLDWMNDDEKVKFDVSLHPDLALGLVEVFDSQIAGGKRYDLATLGRRQANATYAESHQVDKVTHMAFAMDLTPLIQEDDLDIADYTLGYIERFKCDVKQRIKSVL